ncbi:pyridoxamine 5'-phosphate oxidase family protein [Halosegnis sp.]|uniref:pyridoxamine 5'-phosphate oxidase family protein n=1 Tax=Halosegnis sp. TaxID=2864959 RepID=UPI0035D46378
MFPNCPKYIQQRAFERVETADAGEQSVADGLAPAHREWLGSTDTFFIGSVHPEAGADASHRGGDPGFVDVDGDTVVYPDYPGNNMFCTLGNVQADGRVGLLAVDFADGRTLQATGRADIVWDAARVAAHEGAERLVEIHVDRTVELPNGTPLRWSLTERSPFNP